MFLTPRLEYRRPEHSLFEYEFHSSNILLPVIAAVGVFLLLALLAVTTGWLVYRDAAARGASDPLSRGIGAGTLPIPWGLWYYQKRRDLGPRESPVTDAERYVGVVWFTCALSVPVASIVSPPDPFTVGLYALYSLLPAAVVGYTMVFTTEWAYRGATPERT